MLLIQKAAFRELVGGSDDIFRAWPVFPVPGLPGTESRIRRHPMGYAIDASCRKRIVFTALTTNVTLGPVTVHPFDLAVSA
jgi:hypothetical protein